MEVNVPNRQFKKKVIYRDVSKFLTLNRSFNIYSLGVPNFIVFFEGDFTFSSSDGSSTIEAHLATLL